MGKEIWEGAHLDDADVGRYGEIQGDTGRYGETCEEAHLDDADVGRYGEIWGDMGRDGKVLTLMTRM